MRKHGSYRRRIPAAVVWAVFAALPLAAAESELHIPFEHYKLDNGMRVVLSRDNTVPTISVCILYDVGSRYEEKGRTGFAHLFEKTMFEGSANVKKGEHVRYVQSNGGTLGGSAHPDYTEFFETLPSNKLGLALWLESDRMRSLSITAETLKSQQAAAREEKASLESRPYNGAIFDVWPALAFGNFQSAHSMIGSPEDLAAASVDDIAKFFRTWYSPGNAVLAIAGDFETPDAKKLISDYFGDIPSQPVPPRPDTTEPARAEGRTQTVEDQRARFPGLVIGWPAPKRHTPDWYALGMVDAVLTSGKASRLALDLVTGKESLVQLESGLGFPFESFNDYKDPGEYAAFLLYKPTLRPEQILDQLQAEFDRIAEKGVDDTELARVKNALRYEKISSLQTSISRARLLGQYELLDGKPEMADQDFTNLFAVTSARMQAAVKTYLTAGRRDVVIIQPAPPQQPAAGTGNPK